MKIKWPLLVIYLAIVLLIVLNLAFDSFLLRAVAVSALIGISFMLGGLYELFKELEDDVY